MINITFDEFNKLEFKLFENNPIIKNPLTSFVIADPSVITQDVSHDKKFHLLCHTFFGVYMYDSNDGINFKKVKKITNRAMRPNINYIDGTYYLFYERTKPVICNLLSLIGLKWKSEIYCSVSTDL
ncbi:MAG: glycosyl hydrolase family 43, partial [Clostridia bacterium]|nr:glycosyl hydrolase family 43 [Clostridia bacterium]